MTKNTWQRRQVAEQAAWFVGREEELRLFEAHLQSERPEIMLFAVSGQGGVGKTALLRRIAGLAQAQGAVTALTDLEIAPAEVLGTFARQLEAQGLKLRRFKKRYKSYKHYKQQIAADPQAPKGPFDKITRGLAKGAVVAGRRVPVAGVVFDFLNEDAVGGMASSFADYLARKVSNPEDQALMTDPSSTLSSIFLEELPRALGEQRAVLLFDAFEKTRAGLQSWLHDLLLGRYGEIALGLSFVISGRDPLNQYWLDLKRTHRIQLEPFTDHEVVRYLYDREIIDEGLVASLIELSKGLPVLLDLLASSAPEPNQPLHDVSGEAVARFLQWVDDLSLRHTALVGSVPRRFNSDILAAALDRETSLTAQAFAWLVSQSFVVKSADGFWYYHDWVRALMLQHFCHISPAGLHDAHRRLATFYAGEGHDLKSKGEATDGNERWLSVEVERFYHQLSRELEAVLPDALNLYVAIFHTNFACCHRWISMIQQVACEANSNTLAEWGDVLEKGYQAWETGGWSEAIQAFTHLLNVPELASDNRSLAHASRSLAFQQLGDLSNALADCDRAVELNTNHAWALARRGRIQHLLGDLDQAIGDYSQSIQLDDTCAWVFASRGHTFARVGELGKALIDLSRAIRLDDGYVWAHSERGAVHTKQGDHELAVADFTRALDLRPDYAWAAGGRGQVYCEMGRYEEALADFDRALPNISRDDERFAWIIASRGEVLRELGNLDRALDDLSQAIALRPDSSWTFARRGATYGQLGEYEKALADLDRALVLTQGRSDWALAWRGEIYRRKQQYERALDSFDRAIILNEERAVTLQDKFPWAYAHRGETLRQMGKWREALADFDRAIELGAADDWTLERKRELVEALKWHAEMDSPGTESTSEDET